MISKGIDTPSPELPLVLLIPVSGISSLVPTLLNQTHTHTHTHTHSLGIWVTGFLSAIFIIEGLLRVESRVNSTVESGCSSLLGCAANCYRGWMKSKTDFQMVHFKYQNLLAVPTVARKERKMLSLRLFLISVFTCKKDTKSTDNDLVQDKTTIAVLSQETRPRKNPVLCLYNILYNPITAWNKNQVAGGGTVGMHASLRAASYSL